jgi:hypothetical protein
MESGRTAGDGNGGHVGRTEITAVCVKAWVTDGALRGLFIELEV